MNRPQIDELRRESRDAINRKAWLNYDGVWVPCRIQDMSSRGFSILCTRFFCVGQVMELRCEPYQGKEFQCKVEIRHSSEACLGALITEIDEAGRKLCMQLMQHYHSDRKFRFQSAAGEP